ncbi:MAG: hypothetical protein JXA30_18540 [Deltaproteobacteria bacterium]|nr:hypothetical protein [Deltaproteobacteria bacterium]
MFNTLRTRISPLKTALFTLLLVLGCTSKTASEPPEIDIQQRGIKANLDLEAPEKGFQIEILGTVIEPGDDIQWCEVVQLPGTGKSVFYINRLESSMTRFGQNINVSAAIPGSETEANIEEGTRVTCQRAGEVFGEDLIDVISSQQLYSDIRYPSGVGKVLVGGQKIVVGYHYFNTSDEAIPAKVKINFHLTEKNEVRKIARTASFENFTIFTPPGGESTHLAECLVDKDILVYSLTRRTRRWGTDFAVWFAGGDRDGEHIWTSSEWNRDTHYVLPGGPIRLKAGEGFRFECDYNNTTSESLQFGVYATDESCMLQANWWVVDEGEEVDEQGCLLFTVDEDGIARK